MWEKDEKAIDEGRVDVTRTYLVVYYVIHVFTSKGWKEHIEKLITREKRKGKRWWGGSDVLLYSSIYLFVLFCITYCKNK